MERKLFTNPKGKSYQEHVSDKPQDEGLVFEMDHYAQWTIDEMMKWDYNGNPNIIEIQFERLMHDITGVVGQIFRFVKLTNRQKAIGLKIAEKEDISKKSEKEIKSHPHISSKNTTKWQKYFSDTVKMEYLKRFKGALYKMGYDDEENW